MSAESEHRSKVERLCRKGDPRDTWRWAAGDLDYVAEFDLDAKDVPALLEIAQRWKDCEELPEDQWDHPIHAWRALGQLGAVEAVEPLLAMQNTLSRTGDDWFLEEFHDVFGLVGPRAIEPLKNFLADPQNAEFARASTANGLCEIAKRHPEAKERVVEILTARLATHETGVSDLNGFIVSYLVRLKATGAAEVIERAYAADVVNEWIVGRWGRVRQELGVEGLGLVPDPPKPERSFGPQRFFDPPPSAEPQHRERERRREKQAKAKRKKREKDRKRNRRS